MKKLLFLTFAIAVAMLSMGANVDLETARSSAQRFAASKMSNGRLMNPSNIDMKLVQQEMNSVNQGNAVYYIFNTADHFYIISGDDRAPEVLAYGDRPLDEKRIPSNMQHWLNNYKGQMEFLQAHPELVINKKLNEPTRVASVAPLLTAMWDQMEPYYNHCPVYNGEFCVTGCPATSLAMVFYYWKYPVGPTPAVSGYDNYDFQVEPLPSITFDWDNMIDDYLNGYTDAQADAVAWLMRYIGQEEEMDYSPTGSGAYGSDILRAVKFFGYNSSMAQLYYKYSYSDSRWVGMIQEELANNRPIVYCAYDSNAGGHAFNVDGYDATNDTYHINWGWSGDGNCYCVINDFTDGHYTFDDDQQMIIGIQPPYQGPTIVPSVMNMAIESYAEKTATDVLTVYGYYLENDVTLTLNDPNGVFSIDADHVSLSDADAGKDINVTYSPQELGTHSATITMHSEGAEDVVVNLTGTSIFETHNPVMLDANEDYIKLTEFRADWTDETPAKNVESYTLEVKNKSIIMELGEADFSDCYFQGSSVISHWQDYFPEGWVYNGDQLFTGNGCIQLDSEGEILTPEYDLAGYDKITVKIKAKSYKSWYQSGITISTSLQSIHVDLEPDFTDYVFVLDCADVDQVSIKGDNYPNDYGSIANIQILAGDASEPSKLKAVNEEGDADYRLITGITPDKFYTVRNLTAGGTYFYRVKTHYIDDSWSSWSKAKTVTLFGEDHGYELGDVNHDRSVNITDAIALISYVLNDGGEICEICADVSPDGSVNISDVIALINIVLESAK
ncbi:MAG: C10 family peptidase [Muribaculaceae bacterium]|nr:C10 family peptidase [Muribaculaceae bacterium]